MRYPHSWLVWEVGGWTVPETSPVAETRVDSGPPKSAASGDALCFALKAPEGTSIRLGRAVDNEIVIADATVSRFHAKLEVKDRVWSVTPVNDPALVGEEVVGPGNSQQLAPGQAIALGSVRLAYYDSKSFRQRVSTVPLRPSR